MPSTYVALLRGINVGGKNRLPMRDLGEIFSNAGGSSARTYIQSGNVVFQAPQETAKEIPAAVSAAIEARFGFRVPVLLRTVEEMEAVARGNPFVTSGAAEGSLHVLFLSGEPEKGRVDSLDPRRFDPDEFAVRGREVYLHLPNGMGRTKLNADYFDSRLSVKSTARNWRTVLNLLEMMRV